jgi:hypothetical protein
LIRIFKLAKRKACRMRRRSVETLVIIVTCCKREMERECGKAILQSNELTSLRSNEAETVQFVVSQSGEREDCTRRAPKSPDVASKGVGDESASSLFSPMAFNSQEQEHMN